MFRTANLCQRDTDNLCQRDTDNLTYKHIDARSRAGRGNVVSLYMDIFPVCFVGLLMPYAVDNKWTFYYNAFSILLAGQIGTPTPLSSEALANLLPTLNLPPVDLSKLPPLDTSKFAGTPGMYKPLVGLVDI